ncbi:MAG: glycine cleavage system protein GcvH [Thermofilaceae archaeon]
MNEEVVYEGYRFPRNLKYSEFHAWVKVIGEKRVRIGVTDFAQKKVRAVVFIDMPNVGLKVKRGDVLATLESIKAVSEVLSPVSGKVVLCNERLDDDPGLINKDPYGEGWIAEVEIEELGDLERLLSTDEYLERVVKASLGGAKP